MSWSTQLFMTDLQATEADDLCGMKRWWMRHAAKEGIVPTASVLRDGVIAETRKDLRAIAELESLSFEGIREVAQGLVDQAHKGQVEGLEGKELFQRRLGWFIGFAMFVEPTLRAKYETVPLPEEMVYEQLPLWVSIFPGRLLRNRSTGRYTYLQFNPIPAMLSKKGWLEQWHYHPQLHVEMATIQEDLKIEIDSAQMVGLQLGLTSVVDGRMSHPYVRGYKLKGREEWTSTFASGTRSTGEWESQYTWQFPDGLTRWVQLCGQTVADGQFPFSPPVQLDPRLLGKWTTLHAQREREISVYVEQAALDEQIRVTHFPRRSAQCRPAFGETCPFVGACWDQELATNPFKTNEYLPNVLWMKQEKVKVSA